MSDVFDSVRVVDEPTAVKLVGVSRDTWDRMRARGETPPITRLSERRIGYRSVDLKSWLDARREKAPPKHQNRARLARAGEKGSDWNSTPFIIARPERTLARSFFT